MKQQRIINCFYCGEQGHTVKDCKIKTAGNRAKQNFNSKQKRSTKSNNCIRIFRALNSKTEFVLDSGSPYHIVNSINLLEKDSIKKCNISLSGFAGNEVWKANNKGKVILKINDTITLQLENVFETFSKRKVFETFSKRKVFELFPNEKSSKLFPNEKSLKLFPNEKSSNFFQTKSLHTFSKRKVFLLFPNEKFSIFFPNEKSSPNEVFRNRHGI